MDETASYLETLKTIAAGMGPQQGFQAALKALLTELGRRHAFLRPHLVIFDPETRTLRLCVADAKPRSAEVAYEPGVGVTGQVFVTGRPVIVDRLKDHPVFLSKFFERTPEELASLAFLCVPVLAPGSGAGAVRNEPAQVIGVLSVDTPRAPAADLALRCRFLEVVAALIASQAAHLQDDLLRRQHVVPGAGGELPLCGDGGLVAVSRAMRRALDQARLAAAGRQPVLLTGEPGTGKERLAMLIHARSPRRDLPLARFSAAETMPAEPDPLLPAPAMPGTEEPAGGEASFGCGRTAADAAARELFGYRKGAFPGAMQTRKGSFELAHLSSLIVEDVDRLPLSLQARMLRVLQEQAVTRVGGGLPVPVDVRLLCTAGRSLEPLVEQGAFLRELYERISVSVIRLAPLRERREDILPLVEVFLKNAAEAALRGPGRQVERISAPARELLLRYPWPGNIHELIHALEQAVLACDDAVLRSSHLPAALQTAEAGADASGLSLNEAVERFERELLCDALQRARGNMLQAARDLRASYRIVNYKVKKYGIDPRSFAPAKV